MNEKLNETKYSHDDNTFATKTSPSASVLV